VAAAEAPAGMLVDPETEEEDGPGPGPGPGHGRHSDFRTVMFRDGTVYEEGRLEDFLEAMPGEVFRAKGIVRTGRGWFGFQAVGGRLHSEPGAAAPPHGESRMVFFGRGLDGETLRARLALCQLAGSG